jgi:hypothetical protein
VDNVIAIDPGSEESAIVFMRADGRPGEFRKAENRHILTQVAETAGWWHMAIEMIASYGMPVGKEVFDTCVWIGRFIQAFDGPFTLVYRRDVKMHLCGNNTAKDSNIRQALIDKFGPSKDVAIGTKKSPGPLYGVSKDIWAALAVGVTYQAGAVK